MPSTFHPILALLAPILPLVSAHGYVSNIISSGQSYSGTSPEWIYHPDKPSTAGWYAENQDNGYVAPDKFSDPDIICHRAATVGLGSVPVTAGSKLDLQWSTWPESHHGPIITYLASVPSGEFSTISKTSLEWFKIDAQGLIDGTTAPGIWATDVLLEKNLTATVTIPENLAAGNYVLRHEIIALHSAGQENGAQAYPQCINIQVTSSSSSSATGTSNPCSSSSSGEKDTADCAIGTELYSPQDPGILVNIYTALAEYEIPGPKLYGNGGGGGGDSGEDGAVTAPTHDNHNGTVKVPQTPTPTPPVVVVVVAGNGTVSTTPPVAGNGTVSTTSPVAGNGTVSITPPVAGTNGTAMETGTATGNYATWSAKPSYYTARAFCS